MPITPLHLGLMAPFLFAQRKRQAWAALVGFTLVNLMLDQEAIFAWILDQPLPGHDQWDHTFSGALIVGVVFALPAALPYIRSAAWVAGCLFGAVSHVILDAMVHADMRPFDHTEANPFYMGPGAMLWVSAALAVPTALLIAQIVSSGLRGVRKAWAAVQQRLGRRTDEEPSPALQDSQPFER